MSGWPSGLRRQTQEWNSSFTGVFWSTYVGGGSNPPSDKFLICIREFMYNVSFHNVSVENDWDQVIKMAFLYNWHDTFQNKILNFQIKILLIVRKLGDTRVWTRDLSICSRMLYHWAISPTLLVHFISFLSRNSSAVQAEISIEISYVLKFYIPYPLWSSG